MKNLLMLFALVLGLGKVDAQTKKTMVKPIVAKEQAAASNKEEAPNQIKRPAKEETSIPIYCVYSQMRFLQQIFAEF